MPSLCLHAILPIAILAVSVSAGKPDWPFATLPHTTEQGQTGYNDCGTGSSQDSMCQTLHLNSLDDFCLWAPASGQTDVSAVEESVVSWCTSAGHGSRVIPTGTITGAHFLQTDKYIQITGQLIGPNIDIIKGNPGGELDPHGATGNGNPIGGLLYTTAFGKGVQQIKEWMAFMGDGEFCMRACNPTDPQAALQCEHIYDTMGCDWVIPGDYSSSFDSCDGDSVAPPGIYGGSTFHQGDPKTPAGHPAGATSNCQRAATLVPALAPVAPAVAAANTSLSALNGTASGHGSSSNVTTSITSSTLRSVPTSASISTPASIAPSPRSSSSAPAPSASGSTNGAGNVPAAVGTVFGVVGFALGLLA